MNCYFVEFRMADLKHKRCSIISTDETKVEVESKIKEKFGHELTFLSVAKIECNKMSVEEPQGKQMKLDGVEQNAI